MACTPLFDDVLPTTVRAPHPKLCPSQIGEFFLPHPVDVVVVVVDVETPYIQAYVVLRCRGRTCWYLSHGIDCRECMANIKILLYLAWPSCQEAIVQVFFPLMMWSSHFLF